MITARSLQFANCKLRKMSVSKIFNETFHCFCHNSANVGHIELKFGVAVATSNCYDILKATGNHDFKLFMLILQRATVPLILDVQS